LYDVETWKIAEKRGKPIPRMPGDPTPCESCPRGSPEREVETTLSEANWKAYERYLEGREMNWVCVSEREKVDALHKKVMRICGGVQREHELVQLSTMVAHRGLT